MTVLDTFLAFAKGLPADHLQSVEAALAALMDSYADRHEFTPTELGELDRRVAEPKPAFAAPENIATLFGKPSTS